MQREEGILGHWDSKDPGEEAGFPGGQGYCPLPSGDHQMWGPTPRISDGGLHHSSLAIPRGL